MHCGNFYSVSFNFYFYFFVLYRYNYSKRKKKKEENFQRREESWEAQTWEAAAGLSQDWWTQATSLDSRLSGILSYGRSGSIFSETSGAEAVGPGDPPLTWSLSLP